MAEEENPQVPEVPTIIDQGPSITLGDQSPLVEA